MSGGNRNDAPRICRIDSIEYNVDQGLLYLVFIYPNTRNILGKALLYVDVAESRLFLGLANTILSDTIDVA